MITSSYWLYKYLHGACDSLYSYHGLSSSIHLLGIDTFFVGNDYPSLLLHFFHLTVFYITFSVFACRFFIFVFVHLVCRYYMNEQCSHWVWTGKSELLMYEPLRLLTEGETEK